MKKLIKAKDGISTPNGRLKSKKIRNVDLSGPQNSSDVSRTKKDGTTITKSINTSKGFVPTATKTKTVTDASGNVVSKDSKSIGYNKAVRKMGRVAKNVGRNPDDTYRYKTGGKVTTKKIQAGSSSKTSKLKKAQDGISTGEEPLYSGPLTERQTKHLDKKFPSTVTPIPMNPWYNTKLYKDTGYNMGEDPVGTEKAERDDYEKFYRSDANGKFKKGGVAKKKMKTGGMVNSNAKISATKKAGSKGVMSGTNSKASASKVAKGRSGGTSKAPKTAMPKAKYGMSMRKK